jgi:hypothetical protein
MEEKTVVSWLLRHYTITSMHRRDQLRVKAELILRSCQGTHIVLHARPLALRTLQHVAAA